MAATSPEIVIVGMERIMIRACVFRFASDGNYLSICNAIIVIQRLKSARSLSGAGMTFGLYKGKLKICCY